MRFSLSDKAIRQLESLEKSMQKRISEKMRFWSEQENPLIFAKRLTDHDRYAFRVGDMRIIFKTENDQIFVSTIKPRDKAYKDLD